MEKILKRNSGFTLLEMLVGLALSSIVLGGFYMLIQNQQKTFFTQQQVEAMQQNVRSAMYYLEKEIRMAGLDPSGTANAGITIAQTNKIRFSMNYTGGQSDGKDNDGDGTIDEADEFRYNDSDTNDAYEDVTYEICGNNLCRTDNNNLPATPGVDNVVAENIEVLNLVYLNAAGAVTSDPLSVKSVEIAIVARTGLGEKDFRNNTGYANRQGSTILAAPNDNIRRRLVTTSVTCRNLD